MGALPHIDPAHTALASARSTEAQRIRDAVHRERVVGVLGEAEVGKTQTVRQALAAGGRRMLYLDLHWAAGEGHLGHLLAREIAQALASPADFETPGEGPRSSAGLACPIKPDRLRMSEILGGGLEEALRAWPSGRYGWPSALESLEALCERQEVLLWLDHLEAPRLTFRHPLKIGPLLWSLGELVERCENMRLMICGREAARDDAFGARAAFHGRGLWLTIQAPSSSEWEAAAAMLCIGPEIVRELAALTAGHPRTMLLALSSIAADGVKDAKPGSETAEALLNELAARDDGLASRAIEHARSLHRLGGQVLTQAALGQRPYAGAQRGVTTTQDLSKALTRLRLAGLLRHERRWSVVNPLVAMGLRATAQSQRPSFERRPWS